MYYRSRMIVLASTRIVPELHWAGWKQGKKGVKRDDGKCTNRFTFVSSLVLPYSVLGRCSSTDQRRRFFAFSSLLRRPIVHFLSTEKLSWCRSFLSTMSQQAWPFDQANLKLLLLVFGDVLGSGYSAPRGLKTAY